MHDAQATAEAALLDRAHPLLEGGNGRIGSTRVAEAGLPAGKDLFELCGRACLKGTGLEDRHREQDPHRLLPSRHGEALSRNAWLLP